MRKRSRQDVLTYLHYSVRAEEGKARQGKTRQGKARQTRLEPNESFGRLQRIVPSPPPPLSLSLISATSGLYVPFRQKRSARRGGGGIKKLFFLQSVR